MGSNFSLSWKKKWPLAVAGSLPQGHLSEEEGEIE